MTHRTRAFRKTLKKGGGIVKRAGRSEKELNIVKIQQRFPRVCQRNLITPQLGTSALCGQRAWRGFPNPPADKLRQSPAMLPTVPGLMGKTQSCNTPPPPPEQQSPCSFL